MKYFTLLFILLASCSPGDDKSAVGPETQTESKTIGQLLNNYYQDMSVRDWDKYREYFWPRATITTAWQVPGDSASRVDVTTIDDFIRETPNGPDSQPVFEEKMDSSTITVTNNLATAWVSYSAKFGTPENLSEWKGIDVFTLMRHDGQWKIVSLAFESEK